MGLCLSACLTLCPDVLCSALPLCAAADVYMEERKAPGRQQHNTSAGYFQHDDRGPGPGPAQAGSGKARGGQGVEGDAEGVAERR